MFIHKPVVWVNQFRHDGNAIHGLDVVLSGKLRRLHISCYLLCGCQLGLTNDVYTFYAFYASIRLLLSFSVLGQEH